MNAQMLRAVVFYCLLHCFLERHVLLLISLPMSPDVQHYCSCTVDVKCQINVQTKGMPILCLFPGSNVLLLPALLHLRCLALVLTYSER